MHLFMSLPLPQFSLPNSNILLTPSLYKFTSKFNFFLKYFLYTPTISTPLHYPHTLCKVFQLCTLSVYFENLTNFNAYMVNKSAYQVCLRETQKETRLLQQKLFMCTIEIRALTSVIPGKICYKQLIKSVIFQVSFCRQQSATTVNKLHLVLLLNIHLFSLINRLM